MTLHLTPEQARAIQSFTAADREPLRRRAQLLLLYNNGLSTAEVAQQLGLSLSRTRYWRRQFMLRGMAIFPEAAPRPNPAETALALPAPLAAAGVLGDDSLAEAGRKILLFHFAEMLRHEPGTRLGEDIEALHDMRVATRRLRAAFAVFGQAYKTKALKPFLTGARNTGRALGRVRDLDVLLDKLQRYCASLPAEQKDGLLPLAEAWQTERQQARQALIAHLDSPAYETFKHTFNQFLQTPDAGRQHPYAEAALPSRVRDAVPLLLYTRLAAVHAYDPILPTADLAQLHALRIEFKRLRYTVEFFREILGASAKSVIEELKALQDHLGELHDADVTCSLIQQFLTAWEEKLARTPLAERRNPQPIVVYLAELHAERHRLMMAFPPAWERFRRGEFQHNLAQAIACL